jgi:hypothetical protein
LENILELCGINMFDKMAQQLDLQTLGKGKTDFKINKQEFDNFCKEFLFEQIKGDYRIGEAFCKKYDEPNYVLSILPDNSAKAHIKKFYVR